MDRGSLFLCNLKGKNIVIKKETIFTRINSCEFFHVLEHILNLKFTRLIIVNS